jgi:hypothetical protein
MEGATNMIADALANVATVFSSAVTMVTGNAVAMCFVGISLAGAGIGLFHRVVGSRR